MTTRFPSDAQLGAVLTTFEQVESLAVLAVPGEVWRSIESTVAGLIRGAVAVESSPADAEPSSTAVRFAEQFVVDVSRVSPALRAELGAAFGEAAFPTVQAIYVADQFTRGRVALARLFGIPADARLSLGPATGPATDLPVADANESGNDSGNDSGGGSDLWRGLERFMREVATLTALDPVTTEIVRLRGARLHRCRLCESRRSVRAVDVVGLAALADDAPLTEPHHQAAAELVATLLAQPHDIDADLAARLHAHFGPAAVVEIVLDVVRNAANKIAVAFGADQAAVTDGVEFFDLDATGAVVAAIDPDEVRRATH